MLDPYSIKVPRPLETKQEEYLPALRIYNQIVHKWCGKELEKSIEQTEQYEEGKIAFATTGSDGRFEKSPCSTLEVIVLYNGDDCKRPQVDQIQELYNQNKSIFSYGIEVKDTSGGNLTIYQDFEDRVFPTRPFDAVFLGGDKKTFEQYKEKWTQELEDKKRYQRFKKRSKDPLKVLRDQGDRHGVHFDPESGSLMYQINGARGTKHGHLRAVQYKLAAEVCRLVRQDSQTQALYKDILSDATNTEDRFNRILQVGHNELYEEASERLLQEVNEAYKKALYWYHQCEETHCNNAKEAGIPTYKSSEKTIIQVDPGELKDITQIVAAFGSLKKIFKRVTV